MKKFLSLVLSVGLIISMFSIPVFATPATELADTADRLVNKTYSDLGLPSTNWCGYFVGYCINNSAVSTLAGEKVSRLDSRFPVSLVKWACIIKNVGTYYSLSSTHYKQLDNLYKNPAIVSTSVDSFVPAKGDIIIFDWNGRGDANCTWSHAGIVTSYNQSAGTVTYVDGNSGAGNYTTVVKKTFEKKDNRIIGYIRFRDSGANSNNMSSSDKRNPWDYSSTPTRDIRYAVTGNDVKWLQQALNLVMNAGLDIDGSAGLATSGAIKAFQSKYNLAVDGTFGPASCRTLVSALNSMGYTPPDSSSKDNEPSEQPPATYTVSFINGDLLYTTKTVTAGSAYGNLPAYGTWTGYIFDGWYTAPTGGSKITSASQIITDADHNLYAHWTKEEKTWGAWSDWTTDYVASSDTRQVESQNIKVSDEYTEYRYGRYIDSSWSQICWCGTYMESWRSVTGNAILQHTGWSTKRYDANGKVWSCGYCSGDHVGVHHVSSDGRAWWVQYDLPIGIYYWEESRTIEAKYETQYRYRDLG